LKFDTWRAVLAPPRRRNPRNNARMSTRAELLDDLVAANRVLAGLGVLDGFGHVSVRHPERADRYLLSRSIAPELVTADDIMTFDLASVAQDGDTRNPYLERFIHGEIYAQRPDVQAIVHSHAPAVVPFAATSVRLRPIYHMGGFLRAGAPVFEIRERFGTTDMLVRDNAQGAALAEVLAGSAVVLMRGHGFCTVGESIPVAVYRAHYTQTSAALQQQAIALGGTVNYLDAEEATRADETNRRVVARPWALWKAKYHTGAGH
jgi:ribulose-5-phosphate 4-epimerase/fuculose-1-phosphate aldolase